MADTYNPVQPPVRSTYLMLAALVVGGVTAVLDTTIVTIGLHTLVVELDAPVSTIQWVSTAYLLAIAVAIPFVSWAQGKFGGKRLWIFALSLFVLGSLLCASSGTPEALIISRVVQGLGGGIMLPLMQTLAMQNVAPENRTKTMATVGLPAALGPILGPVLGGIVLHWLSWQWLFLINVPIGIVGLVLAAIYLADDRPGRGVSTPRLDILGVLLLSPALAALLFGLSNSHAAGGFGRVDVFAPVLAGAILLAGFIIWALRRDDRALVDIRLLGLRSVRVSSLILAFAGATLFTSNFILPLYLQQLRGMSVLAAALFLIPQGVGSLVARFVTAKLVSWFGPRLVTVSGFLLIAVSTIPFIFVSADGAPILLGTVLFVRGLGLGVVLIPVMTSAYADIRKEQMPHASAITRISQQLGGAFGTALIAVVLTSAALGSTSGSGFDAAFWVIVVMTLVAGLLSGLLPRYENNPAGQETSGASRRS